MFKECICGSMQMGTSDKDSQVPGFEVQVYCGHLFLQVYNSLGHLHKQLTISSSMPLLLANVITVVKHQCMYSC